MADARDRTEGLAALLYEALAAYEAARAAPSRRLEHFFIAEFLAARGVRLPGAPDDLGVFERVIEDDEIVAHGAVIHVERMSDRHIWANLAGETFDFFAERGKLTWLAQAATWPKAGAVPAAPEPATGVGEEALSKDQNGAGRMPGEASSGAGAGPQKRREVAPTLTGLASGDAGERERLAIWCSVLAGGRTEEAGDEFLSRDYVAELLDDAEHFRAIARLLRQPGAHYHRVGPHPAARITHTPEPACQRQGEHPTAECPVFGGGSASEGGTT